MNYKISKQLWLLTLLRNNYPTKYKNVKTPQYKIIMHFTNKVLQGTKVDWHRG